MLVTGGRESYDGWAAVERVGGGGKELGAPMTSGGPERFGLASEPPPGNDDGSHVSIAGGACQIVCPAGSPSRPFRQGDEAPFDGELDHGLIAEPGPRLATELAFAEEQCR